MSPPVVRVMRVLSFLASHPDDEFSISELARRLNLNKATCHAIVTTLVERQYLTRSETDGRIQLGPALIPIGDVSRRRFKVLDVAAPELEALAADFEVVVVASVRARFEIVHLARFGANSLFDAIVRPGSRVPLIPPLGTTFFAWASWPEIEEWLSRLPQPHSDLERYRDSVVRARRLGFIAGRDVPEMRALETAYRSTERDPDAARPLIENRIGDVDPGDYLVDLSEGGAPPTFIAAPVFDASGAATMAITAEFPVSMRSDLTALAPRLVEIARRMTLAAGGFAPRFDD
jgi:DNA-binding IclR family transcriptional regulator